MTDKQRFNLIKNLYEKDEQGRYKYDTQTRQRIIGYRLMGLCDDGTSRFDDDNNENN